MLFRRWRKIYWIAAGPPSKYMYLYIYRQWYYTLYNVYTCWHILRVRQSYIVIFKIRIVHACSKLRSNNRNNIKEKKKAKRIKKSGWKRNSFTSTGFFFAILFFFFLFTRTIVVCAFVVVSQYGLTSTRSNSNRIKCLKMLSNGFAANIVCTSRSWFEWMVYECYVRVFGHEACASL